ncbi:biotin holocarboxylase synthetase [Coemansia sp. RSA 2049]|nr:biotin holocarboxylase synthetase [Coemansia sp. RSA 2049]
MVALNVLVYCGPGIGLNAYAYLVRTLRQFLGHRYAIIPVDPETLRREPWESKAAMLVVPGGRDMPYVMAMHGEINKRIKEWVYRGGRYLGFCAGGYYGSEHCEFEPGTPIEVVGDRELAFFKGTCIGCAYPGYNYKTEDGARAAEAIVDRDAFKLPAAFWKRDPTNVRIYYNGGGYFLTDEFLGRHPAKDNAVVLVRYSSDVSDPRDRSKLVSGAPAVISCRSGRGVAVLSGLHPEYAWDFLAPSSYTQPYNKHMVSLLRSHDAYRRRLLGAMLAHMQLDVDKEALVDHTSTEYSIRMPAKTPTFLVPARVSSVAAAATTMYSLRNAASARGQNDAAGIIDMVLHDIADDIHIISAASEDGQRRVPHAYQDAVLLASALDPALKYSLSGLGDIQPEQDAIKDQSVLVLCTQDSLPGTKETPRFDMKLAIKHMQENKAHTVGSWLMYSDTTNSTQTFLEKNTALQALLPNGTVNVATIQLAGRGRGRNAWVSPVGCLQFTMLLRHPSLKQAPVVMMQYLMSVSVVEAVKAQKGYGGIPLRLKWPNDVYALHTPVGDSSDSSESTDSSYAKIGGILVSSSFKAGEFTLLFGCGINVANPLPTTSINKLIHEYNISHGTSLPAMSMEKVLALVTAKFEELYRKFLVNGFEPLLQLYYKNWLHTDQHVTLVDQNYEKARVVGLCPTSGLLKVKSIANPATVYELQPDGNSFDMLQGLISRKTNA